MTTDRLTDEQIADRIAKLRELTSGSFDTSSRRAYMRELSAYLEVQEARALSDRAKAMAAKHEPLEERALVNIVNGMAEGQDIASQTYVALAKACLAHRARLAACDGLASTGEHHRCGACQYNAGMDEEAEQLRAGIEEVLRDHVEGMVPARPLRRLLDRVDARDSLAHLTEMDDAALPPPADRISSEALADIARALAHFAPSGAVGEDMRRMEARSIVAELIARRGADLAPEEIAVVRAWHVIGLQGAEILLGPVGLAAIDKILAAHGVKP